MDVKGNNLAQSVILHADKKRKRGKNPSLSYKGERNPRKALLLALVDVEEKQPPPTRRRSLLISGLSLIGSGHYCPDCGGLCGNDKHSRRW